MNIRCMTHHLLQMQIYIGVELYENGENLTSRYRKKLWLTLMELYVAVN